MTTTIQRTIPAASTPIEGSEVAPQEATTEADGAKVLDGGRVLDKDGLDTGKVVRADAEGVGKAALPAGDQAPTIAGGLQFKTLREDFHSRLLAAGFSEDRATALGDLAETSARRLTRGPAPDDKGFESAFDQGIDHAFSNLQPHEKAMLDAHLSAASLAQVSGVHLSPAAQIEADWKAATAAPTSHIDDKSAAKLQADFAKLSPTEQQLFVADHLPSAANQAIESGGQLFPQTLQGAIGYFDTVTGPRQQQDFTLVADELKTTHNTVKNSIHNIK